MLVEQPFPRDYGYVYPGSYRRQEIFGVQHVMQQLRQLPTDNFQEYYGVSREQNQGWQQTLGCSNYTAAMSCEQNGYNTNSISGGAMHNQGRESKRVLGRNNPNLRQQVSAFGPKHAEHARRFYKSKRMQPVFQHDLIPPYRPSDCPIQVSYIKQTQAKKGPDFLGEPVFKRTMNQTTLYTDPVCRQVPVPVTFEHEAVLKVAKISSRPDKKQQNNSKVFQSFSKKLFKINMDKDTGKKSMNSQDVEDDIDLSNAPVFQILCEISKI